jgi:PDZ domain-containing protein
MAGCPRPHHPPGAGTPAGRVENEDLITSGQMLQDGPSQTLRLQVLTVAGAVIVLLVAGLIGILKVGADGYYVLSPGQAPVVTAAANCRSVGGGSFALPNGQPCVQLVVPAGRAHAIDGSIMMVDVFQGKPSPWQFLLFKLNLLKSLGNDAEFLPNAAILGNGSAAQLSCQDTEQAVQATSAAPVAALRHLGYQVKEEDTGAQVDLVLSGTPAADAGVQCNDVVTAVNGQSVHTADQISSLLHGMRPGTTVRLTVSRSNSSGPTRTLVLTARLGSTPAIDHTPANPNQGFLGVQTETRTAFDFPFPVQANVGSIGGPSDGLALALGFIDTLSQGRLTGGLQVAATGQIDPEGNVVAIGGAAQKAVAVRKAGGQVFLVPVQNYAAAKSEAGQVKVYAVSTLTQALADLKALGGQVPTPTASGV